jgi:DnaK suppressor protein
MSGSELDIRAIESKLRQRYEVLWEGIRAEVQKYRGGDVDLVRQSADPDDQTQADVLRSQNILGINRDVSELQRVQSALARIKNGSYGICDSCGEAIEPARLKAMPEARHCFECRSAAEKRTMDRRSL